MTSSIRLTGLRTGLALAALSVTPVMFAAAPAATPDAATPAAASIFNIPNPTADYRYQPAGVSSSDDVIAANDPSSSLDAERDSLSYDGAQPPPGRRRSYGRSRYQDRMHNADGSSKIAFVAGAGMNVPNGSTAKYYTPHFALDVGAGLNFNKTFGILAEFSYQRMGLTAGAINQDYTNTYNYFISQGNNPSDVSDYLSGFDANAHIWGISVNPIVNLVGQGKVGAYVTGGVGYYRKTTNFTLPQLTQNIYGGIGYVNSTFDSYGAGGLGYNGGVGLTYKLSEFSSERLFVEARYQWVDLGKTNNDFFAYNKRNTGTIPITVGVRF
ncbi:hypothetical protein Terro_1042 [Terriglobus roseus DSM 18391]|uniref:Uncharacterized protein n=1 Tax=Terriglobus roseus (strain DSM 18391 / NRRL B-41598 / KBS 63) TaxID=926566 RepID=I3ZDP5_TERRK|nr:outer membrane beta-barrel protein [Terriglobus roseus]AFL87363.1 hypothetical protein Terro_1042 [Terriglobus roseus DSM 18391]